jgi:hypothetical protein
VDWRERATLGLSEASAPHLTLADGEGFPLPFRTRRATLAAHGFELELPAAAPWLPQGPACLTFDGRASFVGEVRATGTRGLFVVDHVLRHLPYVGDLKEFWWPSPLTRRIFMDRLRLELARRGQPVPRVRQFVRHPAGFTGVEGRDPSNKWIEEISEPLQRPRVMPT